ncbi:MAG: hypothetical protein HKN12_08985, partial [Gemmatimonadetes bacterium]|nr:hypothetical protein [Gemmatimonadota bacterium]
MSIRDLRTFVTEIDRIGELKRISVPVDPRLEITEIVQRVVREEGPALLFENVEGADFPMLINTFGSRKRIELALGRPPGEIGESLVSLAKEMNPPSFSKILGRLPDILRVRGMKPRRRNGGPVREVESAPQLD